MKLSELAGASDDLRLVYGVEVDTDLLHPPQGMRQIGLLYQGNGTDLDDDFLDSVVACIMADIDVIVEIPSTQDVDAARMMAIAGNVGVSLALLPPQDEDQLDAWCARCADFARAYLTTPHFTGDVYPVSGYFGHLVAQTATGLTQSTPTDPYVVQRFLTAIPSEWSDQAKKAMLDAWEDMFDGSEAFENFQREITNRAAIETMNLLDRLSQEQDG